MAHEYAHYEGAIGPEGTRRTVTFYGPVIGGLPIQAWHCEVCGLLRLSYPDGREEERRLFPGPQPGLLAEPTPMIPEKLHFGLQPRVSGLTAQPVYFDRLAAETGLLQPPLQWPTITIKLPEWDALMWLTVGGMSAVAVMLFLLGAFAVFSYSTPSVEVPLAIIGTLTFVAVIVIQLGVAAVRHFFPAQPLTPSVAETARVGAPLDATTRFVVTLLVMATIGLFVAGILAVYTYSTPGAEGPVIVLTVLFAAGAAIIKLVDAAVRHFRGR
jgi:hypothetical protein